MAKIIKIYFTCAAATFIKISFAVRSTALRLGTAPTEAILKRFSRNSFKHPTYLALMELGRAIKTRQSPKLYIHGGDKTKQSCPM